MKPAGMQSLAPICILWTYAECQLRPRHFNSDMPIREKLSGSIPDNTPTEPETLIPRHTLHPNPAYWRQQCYRPLTEETGARNPKRGMTNLEKFRDGNRGGQQARLAHLLITGRLFKKTSCLSVTDPRVLGILIMKMAAACQATLTNHTGQPKERYDP